MKNAVWIWNAKETAPDEYAEFYENFTYDTGNVTIKISADSNYAVYVNGTLAAWGQYADYPYDKVYDEMDITGFCRQGNNRMAILVWYYGVSDSQVYYPGNAAVRYEVSNQGNIICCSSEETLSRLSRGYISHECKIITRQLGLSFHYDATAEDDWMLGNLEGFSPSVLVAQDLPLRKRPCKKLSLMPEVSAVLCKRITDTDVVYDLGGEQVGFLSFELDSPCEQEILVAYGEHIVDGCVRRKIAERDFCVRYRAKKGRNVYMNPFRRLGCRYLEVHTEEPIQVERLAIAPTMYPLEKKTEPALDEKQKQIYDVCIETLRLCMHEHYEDCPWREQALYTMDSRNQMLCGYYAFGEYEFPRANLELIAHDRREDGLLSICYPIKWDFVIPSFSLHYIIECREYLEYSGDITFLEEIYPKLVSVLDAFLNRRQDGLVPQFPGENYWNFYEWRKGLDGEGKTDEPDIILNALLSYALGHMGWIADKLGRTHTYYQMKEELNLHIINTFWNEEEEVFFNFASDTTYSQLGNALAILCGAADDERSYKLARRLWSDPAMTPISLSMKCFLYDAWLKVDKEHYRTFILEDIEHVYTPMLEAGSTTVWETELGDADFDNAGSLCHGWSALPVYYYHILCQ